MKTKHHPVCASCRNVEASKVVVVTEQGPTDVASAPSERAQSDDAPLHLQRNDWVVMTTLASLPHLSPPPSVFTPSFEFSFWYECEKMDDLFTNMVLLSLSLFFFESVQHSFFSSSSRAHFHFVQGSLVLCDCGQMASWKSVCSTCSQSRIWKSCDTKPVWNFILKSLSDVVWLPGAKFCCQVNWSQSS